MGLAGSAPGEKRLGYPPRVKITDLSFGRSILCGCVPLGTGVAVFRAWEDSRWDPLELAGIVIIVLGVLATIAGAFYFVKDKQQQTSWSPASLMRATLAVGFLIACYPAAVWVMIEAADIMTSFGIEIRNESTETLTSCRLIGRGMDAEVGPVAPGESTTRRVEIQTERARRCLVTTSTGARHRVLVSGYVTPNGGGDARLTFDAEGNPRLELR
jgi:hypothetical protein